MDYKKVRLGANTDLEKHLSIFQVGCWRDQVNYHVAILYQREALVKI